MSEEIGGQFTKQQIYLNKQKFVQKDVKVEVLDIIMSWVEQSLAEFSKVEQSWEELSRVE